jgi:hypothetical protein
LSNRESKEQLRKQRILPQKKVKEEEEENSAALFKD